MQRVLEGETPFISPVVSFMKATVPTKIISECGLQLCSQKGLWLYLLFAADYLSIYFSFYLKERDGDRKNIHPLVHSISVCHAAAGPDWKQETETARVFSVGTRDPHAFAVTCYLPGYTSAGVGIKSRTRIWTRDSSVHIPRDVLTTTSNAYPFFVIKFWNNF